MDCPSLLLLRGAVVLVMGTIFWRWTLKGRLVPRRDSDEMETGHSDPGADIFLSHSGVEKPFVERLYEKLQRTNYTVFFDQDLRKAFPFPLPIKQAARGCKMGVVVLSENFLTSKWPMMELEMLVSQRTGPEYHVLPLFFRLRPEDLKTKSKLKKWKREWVKIGGVDCAKRWGKIVNDLRPFNGIIYVEGTSEGEYIKKVVDSICTVMPPHVPYDCSLIQGQSRLAQEIAAKFERLDASCAGMVGLHGVGGLGKTTLCKVMVNYYSCQYRGRSFLIEFPSPGGGDKSMIISQCKKALDKLTDASDEHLLRDVDDFDQVVRLMRDRVGRHDVFLAVDNVWENSLEEAKKLLRVGFSANSKIIVTSRSKEVLKDLLKGPVDNVSVDPLPALGRKEAFHIFQETFEQDNLDDLVDNIQMDEMLGKCRFSSSYHALALKALATYVKRVCMSADSKEGIKHQFSCILREISSKDLSEVDKVIRLSYDSLPEPKKRMFLNFAVWWYGFRWELTVQECFSMLDSESHGSQTTNTKLMNELSLYGLIQMEESRDGKKAPGLHDLCYELAKREIASSPRFLVGGITTESAEKIKWEDLEIVWVKDDGPWSLGLFEKLQQCACLKLRLLSAVGLKTRRGIRVNSMPALRVLILKEILVESECRNSTINSGSHSEGDSGSGSGSQEIDLNRSGELQKLEVPNIRFFEEIAGLDALRNLQYLGVFRCRSLKSLDGLSGLVQLHVLNLRSCTSLENLPDMRRLTCLERLDLFGMAAIEEVGGLPSSLERVSVQQCGALKRMPDVSSLTRLKKLRLGSNAAMEEVGGLPSSVEGVFVKECGALKKVPDMSSVRLLKKWTLRSNAAMEEVGGLLSSLNGVSVKGCGALKRMPDVSSLTCLKKLTLRSNAAMEEVGGLPSSLEGVSVEGCGALKRTPDVSSLTRLKALILCFNAAMEEVGGLPSSLEGVFVEGCGALKRMPDVSSLTRLKALTLGSNEAMEEVGGLPSSLEGVSVYRCGALKRTPDVSSLTRLKTLTLCSIEAMEEVGGLPSSLKEVSVKECGALKRMPDVSSLTRLKALTLGDNEAMEEVGGLPSSLEGVSVIGCGALKRMPDLSSLTRLKKLHLAFNAAMEEVGGHCFCSSLTDVIIVNCPSLRSCPRLDDCKHLRYLESDCAHLTYSFVQNIANLATGLEGLSIKELDGSSFIKKIDVGCLSNLDFLFVRHCGALEEVAGLTALRNLTSITIEKCPRLNKLNVGCPTLKRLKVKDCEALEQIIWVGGCGALEEVAGSTALCNLDLLISIKECPRLKKLNVGCRTYLRYLWVKGCGALEEVAGLTALRNLDQISIKECPRLKELNVGCLTNLHVLCVEGCGALEEVAGLTALPNLLDVTIKECPRLKKLNLGCPSLRKLEVEDCKALEQIIWDSEQLPARLREVRVQGCNSLRETNISACIRSVLRM